MAQDPGAASLGCISMTALFVAVINTGNTSEKEISINLSLDGFDTIDEAKTMIEAQCSGIVSCADVVAFAARDGAFEGGSIHYDVPAGRRVHGVNGDILRVDTIGTAGCWASSDRLYNFKGTYLMDPALNQQYGAYLKTMCHGTSSDQNVSVSLDPVTPDRVDNMYYKNLMNHKGLLSSDRSLTSKKQAVNIVTSYASQLGQWSAKFVEAMVKMGSIDVLTGSQGEIRKNCRGVN